MTIKQITSQQLGPYFDLQNYAFPADPAGTREKRTDKIWDNVLALGAYSEEDELKTALVIRNDQVFFHGKTMGMGGIASVASYPEARGQGNVRKLFTEALNVMREENQLLSYLSPFSYSFYRQFGYELVFESREYHIKDFSFNFKASDSGTVERVKWEDEEETIKALYSKKYESSIGPVDREEWVWSESRVRSDEQTIALYTNEAGEPEGYVFYRFNLHESSDFKIDELVSLTGEAEKALWTFIGTHGPHFETFIFKTGAPNNLSYLFKEPRSEQKWVSGMMARIVDFEAFLKVYPFKNKTTDPFYFEVVNDFAEWNNGVYKIDLNKDEVMVRKVEEKQSEDMISADIQTWSQLFMGTHTAEDLCFQGKLNGKLEVIQALDYVLEIKKPELYDFF